MSLTLASVKVCFDAVVAAYHIASGDGASAVGRLGDGGKEFLDRFRAGGRRLGDASGKQLRQLAQDLDDFVAAERVTDRDAMLQNLHDFAPEIIRLTMVSPMRLASELSGDWRAATDLALKSVPAEAHLAPFRDPGRFEHKALRFLLDRINDALFAPETARDELDRAIAVDTNARTANVEDMVRHLMAKAGREEQLVEENRTLRQQLEAALSQIAAAAERGDTQAVRSVADLRSGEPAAASRYFRERAAEQERLAAAHKTAHREHAGAAAREWMNAGVLALLDDSHGALEAFRNVTRLDPDWAEGWNQLARVLMRLGDFEPAEAALQRVQSLAQATGDDEFLAVSWGNLGVLHTMRGDLQRAEEMHLKSLALNEAAGRTDGIAADCGNLGVIHRRRGELDRAEAMFVKSLELNQALGRKEGIANQYGNLGALYGDHGDVETAEEMFRRSLELEEEMGRKAGAATVYGNLGILASMREDFDNAEEMFRKSLAIEEELGHRIGMANDHANLGNLHRVRGDREKACEAFSTARRLFVELGVTGEAARVDALMREAGCPA